MRSFESLSLLYRPEPGDQVQSLSFIRIVSLSTDIISVQTTGFFALVISFFVIATNNHSSVNDHRNCVTQWNTCCEFGVSPTEGERGEYNKMIIILRNKNFIGSLGQSLLWTPLSSDWSCLDVKSSTFYFYSYILASRWTTFCNSYLILRRGLGNHGWMSRTNTSLCGILVWEVRIFKKLRKWSFEPW